MNKGNIKGGDTLSVVKFYCMMNPDGQQNLPMSLYPTILRNALVDPTDKAKVLQFKSVTDPHNSGRITLFGYVRYIMENSNLTKCPMTS